MATFGRGISISCCMSSCRRESRNSEEVGVTLGGLRCPLQRCWITQEQNFPLGSAVCDGSTDEIGFKWFLLPSEVEQDAAQA